MQDSIHRQRLARTPRVRLLAPAAFVSAILVAGCGGSSHSPTVASVSSTTTPTSSASRATTSSRSSTTTTPSKDPAQLLVEWASCMRSHGDPNQADPTVTANKLIDIPWNPGDPRRV